MSPAGEQLIDGHFTERGCVQRANRQMFGKPPGKDFIGCWLRSHLCGDYVLKRQQDYSPGQFQPENGFRCRIAACQFFPWT